MEYTVISRRILTGTVSDLPPATRLAWIAVLFEAERLRGRVKLPVRDLAKIASITTPEAAEALRIFQEPDPYSSSKEEDGRRLMAIPGEEDWYQLVTWEKHAAERQAFFNRLRQQRYRDRQAGVTQSNGELRDVTKEPEPEPEPYLEPKPKEKKSPKTLPEDSDAFRLSSLLLKLIREADPKAKGDAAAWSVAMDRLLRIDGRDPTEVERIIRWSRRDSFWSANILSATKLRQQFTQLLIRASNSGGKHEQPPPRISDERRRELEALAPRDGLAVLAELAAKRKV